MNSGPDEPALFDLPLAPPGMTNGAKEAEPAESSPRRGRGRGPRPETLSLFEEEETSAGRASAAHAARPERPAFEPIPRAGGAAAAPRLELVTPPWNRDEARAERPEARPAALAPRLKAGLGDLTLLAAVGAVGALGARSLGGSLAPRDLPALATFLLAFSFLYCVISLAFWGQTPGMAWSGLVARTDETEPLSFGQTALRWLGSWLTWILLGLPALLALAGDRGRSLADRMSGSATYELPLDG